MRILALFAGGYSAAAFAACFLLQEGWLLPLALVSVIFCAGAVLSHRRWPEGSRRAALLLAGLAVGLLWTALYRMLFFRPAQDLDRRTIRMSAVVAEHPTAQTWGHSVLVRVETQSGVPVMAVLHTDEQGAGLRPGDRIETVAYCTVSSRNSFGEPVSYYTAKGIFLQAEAYGRLNIRRPERIPVRYWPAALSQWIKNGIDRSVPEEVSGLIKAVTTGDRQDMSNEASEDLRRTGLSHVVAVSGMHLAMLAEIIGFLLGRGKRSTAFVIIVCSILFCAVAGNTPSVIRAALMVALLQLAPLLGRERDDPTALLFALMVLLLWNPMSAAHVGLQLSFTAVTGILYISGPVRAWMYKRLRLDKSMKSRYLRPVYALLRFCVDMMATTIGASLFTMPLSALYFGAVSLIAPLSNLLVVWMVPALLAGGLLTGLLSPVVPAAGMAVGAATAPLARYFLWVTESLSKPGLASLPLDVVYYRIWLVFVFLLILTGALIPGKKRLRVPLTAACMMLAAAVLFTTREFRRGDMLVTVLDVGQGQSVFIRTGEQLTLVDCGGFGGQNAGDVAADYLQARRVNRLDRLILSHYDEDHINGVTQLLHRLEIGTILLADRREELPLRREILDLAQEKGVKVEVVQGDTCLDAGKGNTITVYKTTSSLYSPNEQSLTVIASVGELDVLLTGDMSSATEKQLLDHAELPDVELMVAGHHGSDSSNCQALLEQVRPEKVVVSAGAHNRYGHPGQQALERFFEVGAQVYRTDLQGTVTIHLDLEQN